MPLFKTQKRKEEVTPSEENMYFYHEVVDVVLQAIMSLNQAPAIKAANIEIDCKRSLTNQALAVFVTQGNRQSRYEFNIKERL